MPDCNPSKPAVEIAAPRPLSNQPSASNRPNESFQAGGAGKARHNL
jgi:hypothetical protein